MTLTLPAEQPPAEYNPPAPENLSVVELEREFKTVSVTLSYVTNFNEAAPLLRRQTALRSEFRRRGLPICVV